MSTSQYSSSEYLTLFQKLVVNKHQTNVFRYWRKNIGGDVTEGILNLAV